MNQNITHISRWRVKLACILLNVNEFQLDWAFHVLNTAPQYDAIEENERN